MLADLFFLNLETPALVSSTHFSRSGVSYSYCYSHLSQPVHPLVAEAKTTVVGGISVQCAANSPEMVSWSVSTATNQWKILLYIAS